ncbi:MAG: hypothetical protein JO345_30040 [Streptosporangiaceae bacterium]|nr:hypothetical protein [Streptosporangiaceae bacterium]
MDAYRAYELLLADEGGQPVPITEDADVRHGRYPLRGRGRARRGPGRDAERRTALSL